MNRQARAFSKLLSTMKVFLILYQSKTTIAIVNSRLSIGKKIFPLSISFDSNIRICPYASYLIKGLSLRGIMMKVTFGQKCSMHLSGAVRRKSVSNCFLLIFFLGDTCFDDFFIGRSSYCYADQWHGNTIIRKTCNKKKRFFEIQIMETLLGRAVPRRKQFDGL